MSGILAYKSLALKMLLVLGEFFQRPILDAFIVFGQEEFYVPDGLIVDYFMGCQRDGFGGSF